jgi:DNA-binding CsgD family transcriptional regulator/PAS domain-containing protein
MHSEEVLLDLVQLIYQAAADPRHWPVFLERYQTILAARNLALGYSVLDQRPSLIVATGADQADIRKYHQYTCPWLDRLIRTNWRAGGADASHHLITDPELERTACFSEFLGPRKFHYGMGAAILAVGDVPAWLVILREKARGPYSDEDLGLLRALLPHMSQALKLHGRISALEAERRGLADSLDRLPTGVLVLDAGGRVLFANRMARRIAGENDGLRIGRDGLSAALPRETAAVRRLVADAARTTNGDGAHAGGELFLSRPSLRRPLVLAVHPLPRDELFPGLPGTSAVAVFVSDPDANGESDGAVLARLYGLTPAERRLTSALLTGDDLREISDTLGISYHTARSQMKSVFGKTGTRRQAELMRLLLKLPAQASEARASTEEARPSPNG